jgi:hypothetical protein
VVVALQEEDIMVMNLDQTAPLVMVDRFTAMVEMDYHGQEIQSLMQAVAVAVAVIRMRMPQVHSQVPIYHILKVMGGLVVDRTVVTVTMAATQ